MLQYSAMEGKEVRRNTNFSDTHSNQYRCSSCFLSVQKPHSQQMYLMIYKYFHDNNMLNVL